MSISYRSETFSNLEEVWARYKYLVLEHSASIYQQIRTLLKDKEHEVTHAFFALIEQALATPVTLGSVMNAYQHVTGYYKHLASGEEKALLRVSEEALKENFENRDKIKAELLKLAQKYEQTYLLQSFYLYRND